MIRGNPTSATSAKALRSISEGYFPPKALLSDNATHFRGPKMEQVCREFLTTHLFSSEYVSHTNGLIEREIQIVLRTLRRLCISSTPDNAGKVFSHWPDIFEKAIAYINSRITPILGTSPRSILFGRTQNDLGLSALLNVNPDAAMRYVFLDQD